MAGWTLFEEGSEVRSLKPINARARLSTHPTSSSPLSTTSPLVTPDTPRQQTSDRPSLHSYYVYLALLLSADMRPTVATAFTSFLPFVAFSIRPAGAVIDGSGHQAAVLAVLPPGLIPDGQDALVPGPRPQEHELVRVFLLETPSDS
jgi:hypothetical protein